MGGRQERGHGRGLGTGHRGDLVNAQQQVVVAGDAPLFAEVMNRIPMPRPGGGRPRTRPVQPIDVDPAVVQPAVHRPVPTTMLGQQRQAPQALQLPSAQQLYDQQLVRLPGVQHLTPPVMKNVVQDRPLPE
ncbi:hypothetical protein [Streptomyces sp. NPDC056154]|uniref:hypothetical protein n=1 Tax=Streptomyces sp. NPDC056154 TaxID=3345729 RepID=UPI0035DD7D86